MKYFTSIEDVQKFAQEMNFTNPDSIRLPWTPKDKYNGLEVEGFSRIVPCFKVCQSWDHFKDEYMDEYYFDQSFWVLEIIPTGELFHIYERARNSKRYALSMFERLMSNRCSYFVFGKDSPNAVGKATQRKLQDWIDYLHEYRAAQELYLSSALERNRSKVDAFKAKYPDGSFETLADGWTTKFSINFERLRIKYTAHEDGGFSRSFEVRYGCMPTDEEILA